MITLERKKTITVRFMGADVTAEFNVPTAEEVETTIRGNKDLKDSDLFKAFVTTVKSPDIEGWTEGLKPEDVVALPGTYPLMNKIALEIMQTAFLSEPEKN